MVLDDLVDFYIDACSFSKGYYTFDFYGKSNGKNCSFTLSTAASVCFQREVLIDVCENFSKGMWDILESRVDKIEVFKTQELVQLLIIFEGERLINVWAHQPFIVELVNIKNRETNELYSFL